MKQNIWSSVEALAWSMDFGYDNYCEVACKNYETVPESEEMYKALCKVFDDELERDMQANEDLYK